MADFKTMDAVFADLVANTDKKFGVGKVISADTLNSMMCGIPCPLPWAYLIGGADVVPLGRVIGGDGPPKHYKSTISYEHARWFLIAGGFVIIVDSEEKSSDSLFLSMLMDLDPEIRRRLRYVKVTSMEEMFQMVTFYRQMAAKYRAELPADQQFPILIIADSLTGIDTEAKIDKVNDEGNAGTRGFSDQAMQIANYYKTISFDDAFVTLMHVQHAKPKIGEDVEYAQLDDKMNSGGGHWPRFKASYHYRMLKTKDVSSAEYVGKDVTCYMVKSSMGSDHRQIVLRVLWNYEWIEVPVFSDPKDPKSILMDPKETMTADEAVDFYEACKGVLSPDQAITTVKALGILSDPLLKAHPKPQVVRKRFQRTWFDWNWTLGKMLHEMMYSKNDSLYEKDKAELRSMIPFTQGTVDKVVSKKIFKDDENHTFGELGEWVNAQPEIVENLKNFLCITHYRHYKDFSLQEHDAHVARLAESKKRAKELKVAKEEAKKKGGKKP